MLNRKHSFTREQVVDAIEYLHHVKENHVGRRLHRTASIVKELKAQGRKYYWSGFNTVYLIIKPRPHIELKIYIQGDVYCYRCRYDLKIRDKSRFHVTEFDSNNGNQLLWELVCAEWLDSSYLPTTKQIQL
jgi:hypothetical protein